MTQEATRTVGRPRLYPFPSMAVGDSFYVGIDKAMSAYHAAYNYGIKSRKKFSARSVDGGLKIWRIK